MGIGRCATRRSRKRAVAIVLQLGVARDLVHRLADADGGGEVDDAIDTRERAIGGLAVADVADDQLDPVRQLGIGAAVDLLLEAVEHDDLVAALDELRARGACR